jgi:hypothetical protein
MKLLDDPKIPTARRNPQRAHHTHKLLDGAVKMGLKPAKHYCTRRRHHHLSAAPTGTLKTKNEAPKTEKRSPPADDSHNLPHLHGPKATEAARSKAAARWEAEEP